MSRLRKEKKWILVTLLSGLFILLISSEWEGENDPQKKGELTIKHVVQGYLGPNHLANLVYRKTTNGDKFVGWGRTPVTEWPVGSASKKQVVPSDPDKRYTNGGCAMDIDGDGNDEIITGCGSMTNLRNTSLIWLKEKENQQYWEEHVIASIWPRPYSSPHDIVPYIKQTESGPDFKAVLVNKSRNELFLFAVPNNPEDEWPQYNIGKFPVNNQSGIELADVNKDGNMDIVSGNFWIEAPDDPTDVPWNFHRFCTWDEKGENRWGGMNKHGIADFNQDGFADFVVTEAEIPGARLSLFLRKKDNGTGLWEEIVLDTGLDAPHSLVVADFNKNGLPDFIVGEMTAGGWDFPLNPNPKLFLYLNQGNHKFKKSILYEGWGVHEMRLFPKPRDGKIMVYAADEIQPQKFNNMNTHVSYWLLGWD